MQTFIVNRVAEISSLIFLQQSWSSILASLKKEKRDKIYKTNFFPCARRVKPVTHILSTQLTGPK